MSGYCTSCGAPIPEGQSICSMCYGDPFYGRDGYYLDWLNAQYEDYLRRKQEEEMSWEEASEEILKYPGFEEEEE